MCYEKKQKGKLLNFNVIIASWIKNDSILAPIRKVCNRYQNCKMNLTGMDDEYFSHRTEASLLCVLFVTSYN